MRKNLPEKIMQIHESPCSIEQELEHIILFTIVISIITNNIDNATQHECLRLLEYQI